MTNVIDGQLDLLAGPVPDGAYHGVDIADENTEEGWKEAADREIEAMARSGIEFTSDDLRSKIGEPSNPNYWGPRFTAARRRGVIEPLGARPATTASAHGRLIRVWRGVS